MSAQLNLNTHQAYGFVYDKIVVDWLVPQNPVLPIRNLAQNVANILTGDCGEFVKTLYKTVAGKYPSQEPHSKDFNLLDVFNTINKREGAIVLKQVVINGRPAGGTVSGAIGHPTYPATIFISPLPAGSLSSAMLSYGDYSYAMTAIHETFHLAGKNGGYNDEQMAQAVFKLTGAPGLPKDGADVYEWSGYWNGVLRSKCPEKRK